MPQVAALVTVIPVSTVVSPLGNQSEVNNIANAKESGPFMITGYGEATIERAWIVHAVSLELRVT